jgi:hypothetical protein
MNIGLQYKNELDLYMSGEEFLAGLLKESDFEKDTLLVNKFLK